MSGYRIQRSAGPVVFLNALYQRPTRYELTDGGIVLDVPVRPGDVLTILTINGHKSAVGSRAFAYTDHTRIEIVAEREHPAGTFFDITGGGRG